MTPRVRRTAQRRNHVSSKPFKHIAARLLCQPAVHTPFTQGFPQLSGAECLRCVSQIGLNPRPKSTSKGALWSADSNMRPSIRGEKPNKSTNCGHAPSRKSEILSKDQFGVLAKGTLRKLYSRIQAPWPELIEGVCLLTHLMLNERRELHKSLSKPHICSRFIVYTKPLRGVQGGFGKKVDEGGSWGNSYGSGVWLKPAS